MMVIHNLVSYDNKFIRWDNQHHYHGIMTNNDERKRLPYVSNIPWINTIIIGYYKLQYHGVITHNNGNIMVSKGNYPNEKPFSGE